LPLQPATDPEALDKDQLLEHVVRVLDTMTDPESRDLLATLHGLCTAEGARLADALEAIPWGPVWERRNREESLEDQYQRLTTWEHALLRQREELRAAERNRSQDARFGLWQRREQGPEAWQQFLREARRQLEDEVAALEAELRERQGETPRQEEDEP
jgi:hypothetical protein